MNDYFNPFIFELSKFKTESTAINVDWNFIFLNNEYKIPVIYCYNQWLEFDIITILNNDYIQNHNEQEEIIEQMICIENIILNNEPAKNWESKSTIYLPGTINKHPDLRNLTRNNKFVSENNYYIFCIRTCAEYNTIPQKPFQTFSFSLRKTRKFVPIDKWCFYTVSASTKLNKFDFIHPVTQQEHNLYINEIKIVNSNFIMVEYELEPELSAGERLMLRNLNADIRQLNKHLYTNNIIGSKSGYTTIHTKVIFGVHGLPLHTEVLHIDDCVFKELQFSIDGIYTSNNVLKNFSFSFE